MIGILGTRRILILAVLLAVNIALGVTVYVLLMPQHATKDMELNELKGQISTLQADIDRMEIQFEQLAQQKGQFEVLKKSGFFTTQSREQAERIFKALQTVAGVISAAASIQPGVPEDNEEAMKADYKLLRSPIKLHIDAMDPIDVYRYIFLLEKGFPGHLSIQSIKFKREADVSNDILQRIAVGENPVLVQADIEMLWHTMVAKSDLIETMPGIP